jgi:hypothetical protein
VFERFLQDKVIIEMIDSEGNILNFQEDVNELFKLLKDNKKELYNDLRGKYATDSQNPI